MKQPKLAVRNVTLSKQISLVEEINRLTEGPYSREMMNRQEELFTQLNKGAEKAQEEGFTMRGSLIRFQVADGYAHYLIVKDTSRWVHVMHIRIGDAWRYSGVIDDRLDARVAWDTLSRYRAFQAIWNKK